MCDFYFGYGFCIATKALKSYVDEQHPDALNSLLLLRPNGTAGFVVVFDEPSCVYRNSELWSGDGNAEHVNFKNDNEKLNQLYERYAKNSGEELGWMVHSIHLEHDAARLEEERDVQKFYQLWKLEEKNREMLKSKLHKYEYMFLEKNKKTAVIQQLKCGGKPPISFKEINLGNLYIGNEVIWKERRVFPVRYEGYSFNFYTKEASFRFEVDEENDIKIILDNKRWCKFLEELKKCFESHFPTYQMQFDGLMLGRDCFLETETVHMYRQALITTADGKDIHVPMDDASWKLDKEKFTEICKGSKTIKCIVEISYVVQDDELKRVYPRMQIVKMSMFA
jgi:hypothetical protein